MDARDLDRLPVAGIGHVRGERRSSSDDKYLGSHYADEGKLHLRGRYWSGNEISSWSFRAKCANRYLRGLIRERKTAPDAM